MLIKKIVTHLSDNLLDSIMLSLVSKRLYNDRTKSTESYQQLILEQTKHNKPFNIAVLNSTQCPHDRYTYDHIFLTRQLAADGQMIEQILALPNIGSITFIDRSETVCFQSSFWISAIPLFEGLVAKGVIDVSYI
ncbi:hypothetical protein SAMD00019534_064240 [Acytostelium subglobosum LB1]|uniref:hypothetical protein n=1 Tax=Acytostelium subglobosum LB1 TaxID=1410327 RepID=UPI0006450E31|nr:hypothetical protein SAMD00019534_064240 [Acytostelium subglobosum LB1]GAM23249.1 hypothetical protein SAMD00019534_064240 [Acytostelium subglobosum LB1]|eukprot:XP_012753698.1 hypothetical protein SAMD00019534_064240 [Acytostelium subglobosum LB1]